MATKLAATKLMLVRNILLDIGKLPDGSFALGDATTHAAAVSDVAIDSQRRKPTGNCNGCGNCACTSCAVTAVTDAPTYRSTVPQVSRLRQSISMKRTSAARPHELDTPAKASDDRKGWSSVDDDAATPTAFCTA